MILNLVNRFLLLILVVGVIELSSRSQTLAEAVPDSDNATTVLQLADSDNATVTTSGFNDTVSDTSQEHGLPKLEKYLIKYQGVILRALLVLGSVTGIVLVYLFIRCIWVRNGRSKSKKYGLITRLSDDNLELRPLDAEDDEDEDMTVFERASQKTSRKPSRKK